MTSDQTTSTTDRIPAVHPTSDHERIAAQLPETSDPNVLAEPAGSSPIPLDRILECLGGIQYASREMSRCPDYERGKYFHSIIGDTACVCGAVTELRRTLWHAIDAMTGEIEASGLDDEEHHSLYAAREALRRAVGMEG